MYFNLASTYKTENPITGIVPGTPVKGSESADDDDEHIECEGNGTYRVTRAWQREATRHCLEAVGAGTRWKFQKFMKDETLDRIRKDKSLMHAVKKLSGKTVLPLSNRGKKSDSGKNKPGSDEKLVSGTVLEAQIGQGKIVGVTVRVGQGKTAGNAMSASEKKTEQKRKTRSSSTCNEVQVLLPAAKKRGLHGKKQQAGGCEAHPETMEGQKKEGKETAPKRKHYPRCVVCTALAGKGNSNAASQSVFYCSTCGVYLCICKKDGTRIICFEKWHNVADLSSLLKNNSPSG